MIKELIQFTENLNPEVFKWNLRPPEGLHLIAEFRDEKWQPLKYEYYDGKSLPSPFLTEMLEYQQHTDYISMNKVKSFDPTQKIHTCSPFAIAFNFNFNAETLKILQKEHPQVEGFEVFKKEYRIIKEVKTQLKTYFDNARKICLAEENQELAEVSKKFETYCHLEFFEEFVKIEIEQKEKNGKTILVPVLEKLGDKSYVRLYFKNVPVSILQEIHDRYIQNNLFLKPKTLAYNYPRTANPEYSLGSFLVNDNEKMPFLKHYSAPFFIKYKQSKSEVKALYQFEGLLGTSPKTLPNPLPVFIYEDELNTELVAIFNGEGEKRKGYAEILHELLEKHRTDLSDYYLINFSNTKDGLILNDFDFVPRFRYHLAPDTKPAGWQILNLVNHTEQDKETKQREKKIYPPLKTIFEFEALLDRAFFIWKLRSNYFGTDFKLPKGFELRKVLENNLYTCRRAIYDFVYKSRTEAINAQLWRQLMLSSVLDDIKTDDNYNNTNPIREKLNIWFSLNQHFDPSHKNFNNQDMKSKIPELLVRMREVANNDGVHFADTHEFAFAVGQVIYFLFSKSEAGERTHAVLEAFVQKQTCQLLQEAISQLIVRYKHALSYGHGRFERLAKEVLGFDTGENMLHYVPTLLAGYFAENIIYESAAKP